MNLSQGPRSVPYYTRAISCLLLGDLQVLFPDSVQLSLAEFVPFLISDDIEGGHRASVASIAFIRASIRSRLRALSLSFQAVKQT